ncbi:Tn3 family transposase [Nonomuraea sp. M3C6]|uniref:Tn3 family transposase n=1 Tax=Nonomuraea marmarensis TaxID=3351344 RepID=A0ABW7AUE2_9ACTN
MTFVTHAVKRAAAVHELKRLARNAAELMTLSAELQAGGIQLELLAGPLTGIYNPNGMGAMFFAVLAVAGQIERNYIREKTLEGQVIAAAKGNHGGRPKVIDDDSLTFALALKDKGVPVPDIAKKLTGTRKVPAGAPFGFVPTKWAGYLDAAAGDVTAYRHYWELAVLLGLRDVLRSGDIYVPGSRRYANPASFLLTPERWAPQKVEFCHLVGKPSEAADALAQADDELHTALVDLETQLAKGNPGEVRLTDDGEPLTAEDVPAEADALCTELAQMLPRVPLASVLVVIDARTGFTDHLVHAGGKVNRPAELKRNLLYVVIAEATNMGLTAMSESCGVPYDVLAWTAEWYFRPETLEAANAAIVNYHHRLPLTQTFGAGTLSSSDGQRFPVKGKSITADHLSRYFARGQGVSTYTHVSDQHSTFDTKVIVATAPESHYVLDGLLGNATDLPVFEHATDTHGATLTNFALFDLVGKQLSPRIRDADQRGLLTQTDERDHLVTPRIG